MITWFNMKHTYLVVSQTKEEYMAGSMAIFESISPRKLLIGLFDKELETTVIYFDNQSCIKISKNPSFHKISKHIMIKYHFIRDRIQNGVVKL
jgi:hypothetical protein